MDSSDIIAGRNDKGEADTTHASPQRNIKRLSRNKRIARGEAFITFSRQLTATTDPCSTSPAQPLFRSGV
jgi:hypothetical protein